MPVILDPLTQLEDAIITWLESDPTVAGYDWQRWDSDEEIKQPRGYVDVNAGGEIDLAIQGPILLNAEVSITGKPKRGTQTEVTAIVIAMLSGREVIEHINNQITDGSVVIVGPAESAKVRQIIQRDLRIRMMSFTLPAIWNVVWTPPVSTVRVTTDGRRRITIDGRTRIIHRE